MLSLSKMDFRIDRYGGVDLADQIRDAIIGEITTGRLRAGEKLPTMQEIARGAGVSFRTARNVIERLAREGYVASRPGIGTVVVPKDRKVWRGRVLFVMREEDGASYYVHQMMGEVRRRLLEAGYLFLNVIASRRRDGDREELRAMLGLPVDFAIVMYDSPYAEAVLAEAGVPYAVVCGEGKSRKNAWQMPFSPEAAIAAFVAHCRKRKVRRVTQVDFDDNLISPMDLALAEAGIETDHVLVRSRPELGRFAGIETAAFEKFRDYPRKKYPDVFFIWDTFVARGFFMAQQNLGVRIPEDVFVVAQTNRGLGLSSPCTVTRFEADGVTDGKTVAEFALASLQKGRIPKVPSVGREYVIGGTFPC